MKESGNGDFNLNQFEGIIMSLKEFFSSWIFGDEIRDYRSREWSKVRAAHLAENSYCEICGNTEKLEVHHLLDTSSFPEYELHPSNLMTLCGIKTKNQCHFKYGHLGNYRNTNYLLVSDIGVLKRIYKGDVEGCPDNLKNQRRIK